MTSINTVFPYYNLINGIGLIIGILLIERKMKKSPDHQRIHIFLLIFISGIIFGWLFAHFTDYFLQGFRLKHESIHEHSKYGYTFYGGLIGSALFIIPAWYFFHFNIRYYLDMLAPIIPLMHAIGRIGCFLGGCCYGKIVTIGTYTVQIPTQLISSAFLFALFFFLFFKKIRINRIYLYLWIYPTGRFLIEFMRADPRGKLFTGSLSPSQEISIFIFVLTSVIFLFLYLQKKHFK